MSKKLLITEKPSVAMEFAKALKITTKRKTRVTKKLKTKKLIIKRQLTIKADSRLIRKNSYLSKCQ